MSVKGRLLAGVIGIWAGCVGHLSAEEGSSLSLRWQGWEQQEQGAILQSDSQARLRVSFVKSDVVRIWFEPSGEFRREASLAIENSLSDPVKLSYQETNEQLEIRSERVLVRIQKNPLHLSLWTADGQREIWNDRGSNGFGWKSVGGAVSYEHALQPSEHIFGLGEDNDAYLGRMDRRGTVRDLWTGQEIRSGHVTADIPIPLFLSTGSSGEGYGLYFDNSYRTRWDLGKQQSDRVRIEAEGGELDFYLIYGPRFESILERYTSLTGRPSLPPLWALGFIQSKCTYWNWDEIDDVVQNLRTRQIPMDVMVIDYDWAEVPMNFKWAERWKGLSPQKIRDYEAAGTRFLISNAGPMLRKDASNYAEAKALGLLASDGRGNTVTGGHYGGDIMDFTAPGMKDWLWPQLQPLYESGVDGWWLDLTEPEGEPEQTVYYAGPRAGVHNSFALRNSKAYYEMQLAHAPEDRVFILTRTGSAGIQRYGSTIWTGDIFSDYQTLVAHVPEALNTGLSGLPYWTNDSGGFIEGLYKGNAKDHGRLYERWLQFSVFSPITRAHKVGPSAPYMFGPEVEAGARRYLQMRYQLLPYIYSYAWEASQTGAPLMRAMVYAYQDDPKTYNLRDQYLFGRELLVAPVLTEGAERRRVYFPEGRWIDRDLGHVYNGPVEACVAAPQDRIPVFAKGGAIVPKAPLMDYTGQKPWDPLTLEIYPEGKSSFTLYQDDGETQAFLAQKAYSVTTITVDAENREAVDVRLEANNAEFLPSTYRMELHLNQRPLSVSVEGRELTSFRSPLQLTSEGAWSWDETSRVLSLSVSRQDRLITQVTIRLDADSIALPRSELQLTDCPLVELPGEGGGTIKQIPHFFPPPSLPGRIEAENYDKGGEAIAYHDADQGNAGGVYRSDDVDLYPSDDEGGGYFIGRTEGGEWYEYTVVAPKAGFYELSLRARTSDKVSFHWESAGKVLGPTLSLEGAQAGWQVTAPQKVYLDAGEQVLRLSLDAGSVDINAILVSKSTE